MRQPNVFRTASLLGTLLCVLLLASVAGAQNASSTLLFWHNQGTGKVAYWQLEGASLGSQGLVSEQTLSSNWFLGGVGDINRDGNQDLVWHNQGTGKVAYWFVDGNGTMTEQGLVTDQTLNANWRLAAAGEIDGDGTLDLIWHSYLTGTVAYWLLNPDGSLKASGAVSDQKLNYFWVLENSGDLDNDGDMDLLWHNLGSRKVAYWKLSPDGSLQESGQPDSSLSL